MRLMLRTSLSQHFDVIGSPAQGIYQNPPMSQSKNITLGYDSDGNPWLARNNVPGSGGGTTLLGYDERGYPCARLLDDENYLCEGLTGERKGRIVRWDTPEAYRAA